MNEDDIIGKKVLFPRLQIYFGRDRHIPFGEVLIGNRLYFKIYV